MAQRLDPIPLVPEKTGISKRLSKLAIGSRWIDGDKVRSVSGAFQKIGGHTKKTVASVGNPIRGELCWNTKQLLPFIGMGTSRRLYVVDQGLDPFNITPLDTSGTLTDPFTVTTSSSTVNVEHTAHGRHFGDAVSFDGASAIGTTGMTIQGDYTVTSVIDADNYTIEHSVASSGDDTGGGSVDYEYEIPIGADDPLEGDGFGAGGYGSGNYGEPTEDGSGAVIFEPRIWNLDQYGDLMLANPVNGGIYQFDPGATPAYQRAEVLANAPTVCRSMFVTRERFIFALGIDNDPMNMAWPDQDDPTNWTPGVTSTANTRRLKEGTRLIAGASIANLISGVWSDSALHEFQYTGSSFIYDSRCVGTNCGLVSPLALVVNLSTAYWASDNGAFFMWGGGAPQLIPNVDDISEFVRRSIRGSGYEYKCNGHYNQIFNEIWWFFANTTQSEPGIYVAVSLADYSWVAGTLERTSGKSFSSFDQRPILAGADGYLYQHEDGLDADGEIMKAFLERAPMQLNNGAQLGEIDGFTNDMERQTGKMSIKVTTYERINQGVLDQEKVYFEPDENPIDLHIGGRIAGIVISSEELGGDFRLGAPMLEVKSTGRKR